MNKDLNIIKEKYGEKMMHLCRELFPTLLEEEGVLSNLILSNFAVSKYLYNDIIKNSKNIEMFKNYVYSLKRKEIDNKVKSTKTPKELMEQVGYILYECKTEEDIQRFKKYYGESEKEILCTFKQNDRLSKCHVFFAVKKNVEEIKRKDFLNPEREDLYGTSVISIQFTRGDINTLSIKNRYNHIVPNPDNTYFNNLENIVPGLTDSFEREYGLNINQTDIIFELPGYVKAKDGKYYKYNYEINNIYYCPNNVIIDNFEVKKNYIEKEKYIIIDYFVIDIVNKKIFLYDKMLKDNLVDMLQNIKKIKIIRNKENLNKKIEIINEKYKTIIEIDALGNIIGFENQYLKEIDNNFMIYNKKLKKLNIPKVKKIGNNCLTYNEAMHELDLPSVEIIGDNFLYYNENVTKISAENLRKIKDGFLRLNKSLRCLNLPNVEIIGDDFLFINHNIIEINMPSLKEVKDNFLYYNNSIEILNFPNLTKTGDNFFYNGLSIERINASKLVEVGNYFLSYNQKLESLVLESLTSVGKGFISFNEYLKVINLPKLEKTKELFLCSNYNKLIFIIDSKKQLQNKDILDKFSLVIENNKKYSKKMKKLFLQIFKENLVENKTLIKKL